MPDMLTPQALAMAGPLVLETLFKHFWTPSQGAKKHSEAREDDLMYDEAFILMKTFLETATRYPVAALQRFGLVKTPAPPGVAIHRVCIPQRTLVHSAEFLVKALGGEEMAYKIAGGTKWWQVRAGPGVEGEWVVMKKDWKEYQKAKDKGSTGTKGKAKGKEKEKEPEVETRPISNEDVDEDTGEFREEMDELRCMLYIHGGAYYWGSINTHRYTIWRHARKMRGRCFAVNYRKAPQYPFPCAIQDCLAAYLYLVNPPPGANHSPVDPKKLVIAGDSAGGGLVLALLQILRDTEGLTLPAGAILISPWSDLTHSFPSILENTATDIVPPFGFIHASFLLLASNGQADGQKPSSLWPPPPPQLTEVMQSRMRTKVKEVVHHLKSSSTKDEQGQTRHRSLSFLHREHPDDAEDFERAFRKRDSTSGDPSLRLETSDHKPSTSADGGTLHPSGDRGDLEHHPAPRKETDGPQSIANPGLLFDKLEKRDIGRDDGKGSTTLAQCDTPLELTGEKETVLVDTQIQLYATNAQLCHPWVSPVLGYLGGLPPLFICAGDNEVLRDEITYLAHRAANPAKYPIRDEVRQQLPSLVGIEDKHGPTNVHFQIYDGTCHDLPLFSMTTPARGLFRAIASFARFCTPDAPGSLHINTPANSRLIPRASGTSTPAYSAEPLSMNMTSMSMTDTPRALSPVGGRNETLKGDTLLIPPAELSSSHEEQSKRSSRHSVMGDVPGPPSDTDGEGGVDESRPLPPTKPASGPPGDDAGPRFGEEDASLDSRAKPGEAGHSGIYNGENPFTDHMIRERVSTTGVCRPLEPPHELKALNLPPDEVGVIKEGQAMRYLNGQKLWDKKFHRAAKSVEKHRRKNLKMAKERDSRKLVSLWEDRLKRRDQEMSFSDTDGDGWETDGDGNGDGGPRVGPTDAGAEKTIIDQSWSWEWALHGEAPPPSAIVSRRDFSEARNLALMADRMDDAHGAPIGGLSIWVGLASFFSNSQDRTQARDALRKARDTDRMQKEQAAESKSASGSGSGSRRFGSWFRSSPRKVKSEKEKEAEQETGTSTPSET